MLLMLCSGESQILVAYMSRNCTLMSSSAVAHPGRSLANVYVSNTQWHIQADCMHRPCQRPFADISAMCEHREAHNLSAHVPILQVA